MTGKSSSYGLTITCGFLAAIFLLALRPIESFDTFWQLQAGKYIWQTGQFIYRDIFSQAPDLFRLEHCWLHDLVLFVTYSAGGFAGLSVLKALVIAACAGLLLWWSRRQDVTIPFAVFVLTVCLWASEPSWLARPQLWTFLFSILFIQLLILGRERDWRAWGWLPPIMLAWANLHAGCVFGLVLVGLFGVAELLRSLRDGFDRAYIGRLVLAGVATFAAAFVNPYGYRIPLGQLLAHLKQHQVATGEAPLGMLGNMEWLPTTYADVPLFYWIMAVWLLTLLWRWRRLDPFEAICFVAFAYMGFSQVRHTTLVALLAGLFLPAALSQVFASRPRWLAQPVLWLVCAGAIMSGWMLDTAQDGRWGPGLRTSEYPVAAAGFIAEQRLPRPLYNSYDWGGYLMWRLFPDYPVFIDGRSTSGRHFADMVQIDGARPGFEALLERHGINTIVTRTCYYDTGGPLPLVEALAADPRWRLVFADDTALVYLRRGVDAGLVGDIELPRTAAFKTMSAEASRLYREDDGRDRALLAMARAAMHLGDLAGALRHYRDYDQAVPGDAGVARMIDFLEAKTAPDSR